MDDVKQHYVELCDWYMFKKDDEMRTASDKFFKFFNELIESMHKALPKVQKKKAHPPKGKMGSKAKTANPAQSAMMAELMKKQAAQKK